MSAPCPFAYFAGTVRKIQIQLITAAMSLKRCPTKPLTLNLKEEVRYFPPSASFTIMHLSSAVVPGDMTVRRCFRMAGTWASPCTSRSLLSGSKSLQAFTHTGRRKHSTKMKFQYVHAPGRPMASLAVALTVLTGGFIRSAIQYGLTYVCCPLQAAAYGLTDLICWPTRCSAADQFPYSA